MTYSVLAVLLILLAVWDMEQGFTASQAYQITGILKVPYLSLVGSSQKKTTIAHGKNCDLVSFHGYNGTPFRDVHSLVLHVEAVIDVLTHGVPCIFAGDFNTWTTEHLTAVKDTLSRVGFILAFSWSYPGREFPLDHVFLRGVRLVNAETFRSEADHLGAVIDVEFLRDLVEKEVYVCTGYDGKEIVKEGQQ